MKMVPSLPGRRWDFTFCLQIRTFFSSLLLRAIHVIRGYLLAANLLSQTKDD
jgi:hypothetical protein